MAVSAVSASLPELPSLGSSSQFSLVRGTRTAQLSQMDNIAHHKACFKAMQVVKDLGHMNVDNIGSRYPVIDAASSSSVTYNNSEEPSSQQQLMMGGGQKKKTGVAHRRNLTMDHHPLSQTGGSLGLSHEPPMIHPHAVRG